MCKKLKGCGRRIDPCMKNFIKNLNDSGIPTYASCCGHFRYQMTVVVKDRKTKEFLDLISGVTIPRKKKFYKKDKTGHYFIPEVSKEK